MLALCQIIEMCRKSFSSQLALYGSFARLYSHIFCVLPISTGNGGCFFGGPRFEKMMYSLILMQSSLIFCAFIQAKNGDGKQEAQAQQQGEIDRQIVPGFGQHPDV